MFDFILSFVKSGTDYLVCSESPFLAGQAPPVPFRGIDPGNISGGTSSLTRDARPRIQRDEIVALDPHPIDLVRFGQRLYRRVFFGEVEDLFLRARDLARGQDSGLRILIRSWHEPEIHDIPWEFLHDGRRFLAQSTETPVVRSLEQRRPIREFRIMPPLRVLLTTACPVHSDLLDIAGEERRVRSALSPLGERAVLVVEEQVSFDRLQFLLLRAHSQGRPFHVWHHAGHGHLGASGFLLPLVGPNGSMQLVKVTELQAIFAQCEELRLAVLNVCNGATAAGLATALANLNVPAVIGFREKILDASALIFAETLYQGLVETTLERALSRARLELRDAGHSTVDWSYPLLFARTTAAGPWL